MLSTLLLHHLLGTLYYEDVKKLIGEPFSSQYILYTKKQVCKG